MITKKKENNWKIVWGQKFDKGKKDKGKGEEEGNENVLVMKIDL